MKRQRNIDRRNFLLNVFEGAFYVTGASLISAQTVLPALVERLGGGNIAVGLLGLITWAGVYLPQIVASRIGQTLQWKKRWVVNFGRTQRVMILLIGLLLLFSTRERMILTLPLFLLLFLVNQLVIGLTSPVWFDFFAKLIRRKYRGRSVGLRTALAGIMSFGGTILLTVLLESFPYPRNFAVIVLAAFGFQAVSIVLQNLLVETEPSAVAPRHNVRDYFLQVRSIVRENHAFRRFLQAAALLVASTMPAGFFTVYALKRYGLTVSSVGEFTFLMVIGQITGALIFGYLADLRSNKSALIAAYAALLLATTTALLAPDYGWFRLVFVFLGMNLGSEMMIRYSMAIEFGPAELRSTYLGIMNTILAPCYAATMLGGVVSELFGYPALFLAGIACAALGLIFLITAVREPRVPHHILPSLVRQEESLATDEDIQSAS